MALVTLRKIQLGFGGAPLLDQIDLAIERGERICLLGRNGAGKSTLMKLISGEVTAEDGELSIQQTAVITRLQQDVLMTHEGTVFEVVAAGLGAVGKLIREYHNLSLQLAEGESEQLMRRLSAVQHELESANGWSTEQQVETTLSRLNLDPDIEYASLSGGLKRRVLLARALVQSPDLLILDEPTNHLDIASIDWLEEFLLGYGGTLLFVTHDRTFLQKLATRIIELDRGHLSSWPGDYENYLRRKAEMLNAEEQANARFDKQLAEEEQWIRQGIKARRTRNEGRVRALKAMRDERQQRREQTGQVKMTLQESERSGRLVIEADAIDYRWDAEPVVSGFSTVIMRGDRVGIVGPNGAGKTTLLNLLLGRLAPDCGSVRLGTRLEVAYFDQLRSTLNEELNVQDNLADGHDRVTINGQQKHVISYLQDFLFTPERIRQPVKSLSGGERNRLLLARLFAKPANLLVMDEPTNDLDLETLELLEERLLEYQGTLLLVSHDRAFLDNVVTSALVFAADGRINEYVGGYSDWAHLQQAEMDHLNTRKQTPQQLSVKQEKPKRATSPGKLSYKEQRELDGLPQQVETLEAELDELQQLMSSQAFYQGDPAEIQLKSQQLEQLEQALSHAYERWEMLEGKIGG